MKDVLTKPEINFMLSILVPILAVAIAWGVITLNDISNDNCCIGVAYQNDGANKTGSIRSASSNYYSSMNATTADNAAMTLGWNIISEID